MKKILSIVLCFCVMGVVFAQRPVQSRGNNQTTLNKRDASGIRNAAANSKAYSYTITEMSMPNVTVMDAQATVRQDGTADKLKVTVNGNDGINYYIYDANDQAISKNYFKTASTVIDMSSFQPGEYRVQLLDKKGAEKNFKVIKKQK